MGVVWLRDGNLGNEIWLDDWVFWRSGVTLLPDAGLVSTSSFPREVRLNRAK
jgi:hypothetical protein